MKNLLLLFFISFNYLVFAQNKPNIIFILADDLGYNEISRNGTDFYTPAIDQLAREGVYFNYAYNNAICSPTRASFITGEHAYRNSLSVDVIRPWENRFVPTSKKLISQYLKEQGYTTGIIGKWHLGEYFPEQLPNNRGFDYFFGLLSGSGDYFNYFGWGGYDLQENGVIYYPKKDSKYRRDSIYITNLFEDRAIDFINQSSKCGENEPFFLYLPVTAPHFKPNFTSSITIAAGADNQAPDSLINIAPSNYTLEKKKRWGNIKALDNLVGKVKNAVYLNNIQNNTIIIFCSDNGAPNSASLSVTTGNLPYAGFKSNLLEGGCKTPFIWWQPSNQNIVPNSTINEPIHMIDMLPTFFSLAQGKEINPSWDGIDINRIINGENIERLLLISYIKNRIYAVVEDNLKGIYNRNGTINDVTAQSSTISVYNLLTDLSESTNIAGQNTFFVSQVTNYINNVVDPLWNYFQPIIPQPSDFVAPNPRGVGQYSPNYYYKR
jgi:arylsulfatase A-like enzyme